MQISLSTDLSAVMLIIREDGSKTLRETKLYSAVSDNAANGIVVIEFQLEKRLKAAQDDRYLENVLLEVKRLWPPFLGGRRIAKEVNICSFFLSI